MSERIHILKTFIAADPGDTFSRYALAMEYRKLGDHHQCIRELETLLEKDPNYVGAYYHLGKGLIELGQLQQASEIFKKGIEIATHESDRHALKELKEALIEVELDED
jgi:tetratricopeptide (TPR) repeat protein